MPTRAFGISVLTGRPQRFTIENKSHLCLDFTTTISCRKYLLVRVWIEKAPVRINMAF